MITGLRVADLGDALCGTVIGDPERLITGVSTLVDAEDGDLSFVESAKYLQDLEASSAAAVIVPDGITPPSRMSAIRVPRPVLAMVRAIEMLMPPSRTYRGVSSHAVLGARVVLGDDVGIAPLVVVGDDVSIGRGTELHPSVTIGAGARIGDDCVLHAGVRVYPRMVIGNRVVLHSGVVIGADGFGYVQEPVSSSDEPVRHRKFPQVGRVVIEDDVEIGANSAVDRAAFTETRIGRGTKIDNLVTIGHNSRVGRHCIIIGQAGISGSTVLGDYVTIAGQAGLAGHLTIGERSVVGAQAGVTKSLAAGSIVLGSPAFEVHRARKALALFDRLPEFKKALASHEARLRAVEAAVDGGRA